MGKYFTIAEMTRSDTADRLGIDNRLPKDLLPNVRRLIAEVLDPLREWYGKPVYINSGYRCEALNKAVGGSATSDHMKGRAADITGGSPSENKKLFNRLGTCKLPEREGEPKAGAEAMRRGQDTFRTIFTASGKWFCAILPTPAIW